MLHASEHCLADDKPVRLRRHRDGSLSILSSDGRLIHGHFTAAQINGKAKPEKPTPDLAFFRGLAWAIVLSAPLWCVTAAYLIWALRG